MYAVAAVGLKDRPGRQYVIYKSSATSSSSGSSKIPTLVIALCKECLSVDMPIFKINNPEVRNSLLKNTQTDPPELSM
jgi:predicted RNA-binding protein